MIPGLLVAVVVTALAALLLADAVRGMTVLARADRPSYARLRRELRERRGTAFSADELDDLTDRLARVDRIERRRPRIAMTSRLVALALVGAGLAVGWWVADGPTVPVVLGVVTVVALVAAIVAGVAAVRVGERRWAVAAAQRSEVVRLLEDARLPQRQRVPGLGDRVTRALAILREKQR